MRELTLNEVQEVSGGIAPAIPVIVRTIANGVVSGVAGAVTSSLLSGGGRGRGASATHSGAQCALGQNMETTYKDGKLSSVKCTNK